MKNAIRLLLAFLLCAALAVVFFRTLEVRPQPAASPPANDSRATPQPASAASPSVVVEDRGAQETPATATGAAAPAAAPLLDGDPAREAITDLAVTYDAASVPALARYLAHSDPEIRAAARDGLVQLGERAAIPFLETAAKTAPADEAKELREAAEFLALPTWTEHRAAQKKARAAAAP